MNRQTDTAVWAELVYYYWTTTKHREVYCRQCPDLKVDLDLALDLGKCRALDDNRPEYIHCKKQIEVHRKAQMSTNVKSTNHYNKWRGGGRLVAGCVPGGKLMTLHCWGRPDDLWA